MNSRVLVVVGVGVVIIAAALFWRLRPLEPAVAPPAPSPSLRFSEGELGRFDRATQGYVPLPVGSEVRIDEPLMSGGGDTMFRLSTGGTIVAGPRTAVTLLGSGEGGALRLRLDDGRLWLHLKAEEQVEVSSFRSRISASRGDCEVRVYKDKDHYLNTRANMWAGQGRLRGGDKLRVERPLAPGLTVHVDDATVYPVARFETGHPDEWQKRMLALP